jgi:SAM-dependent methyltransferase
MFPLEIFKFSEKKKALLDEIMSITKRSTVGWHYCLDYSFVLEHFDPNLHHRILDVGCGPLGNPLHDYIEKVYDKKVFGIDRKLPIWKPRERIRNLFKMLVGETKQSVFKIDWAGDLMQFNTGNWDLILAVSSLEHNQPQITNLNWRHASKLLAHNGRLINTFSISSDGLTKWNENTKAMDLSIEDAERIWDCEFSGDFEQVVATYEHPYLHNQYIQRFGHGWEGAPPYIAAGTIKGN